jgi:hypothetical protein
MRISTFTGILAAVVFFRKPDYRHPGEICKAM